MRSWVQKPEREELLGFGNPTSGITILIKKQLIKKLMPSTTKVGHEAEKNIIECFYENKGVIQRHGRKRYIIDPEKLYTNIKLTICSKKLTEQDCAATLKRKSRLIRFLNKLFYVKDEVQVFIQSKKYNKRVSFEKVLHDLVHTLMSAKIGENIIKGTYIVEEERTDPLLEKVLESAFRVKILTRKEFENKHSLIELIGKNKISCNKYAPEKEQEYAVMLGEMYLLDHRKWIKPCLKLKNVINVDTVYQENKETLEEKLWAPRDFLNPEIYLYVASAGISPKGRKFLEFANVKSVNYTKLNNVLKKGRLFKEFEKIKYSPFGIGEIAIGEVKSNLYAKLDELNYDSKYGKSKLINYKTLQNAINRFIK